MSEWISVKDRLPEESGYVLVVLEYPQLFYDMKEVISAYYGKHDNLFLTDGGDVYNADLTKVDVSFPKEHVAYWMPLPEPPKEDEDGN